MGRLAGPLAFLAALALATPALADTPASQAVSLLDAQRAANGIPAGLVEQSDWSAACAMHNEYERANGGGLTFKEVAGNPGYSDEGAFAGHNSVLSRGATWHAATRGRRRRSTSCSSWRRSPPRR